MTEGINIEKLKEKYQPHKIELDLTKVIAENKDLFHNLTNEAAIQNMKEFQAEKYQNYEDQIEPDKSSKLKGWGCWTGPNIK